MKNGLNSEKYTENILYPKYNKNLIFKELEKKMETIKGIVSCIHSLRKNNNIKVRQPLSKVILFSPYDIEYIYNFKDIITTETNIKEIIISNELEKYFDYKIKPNYKILGEKYKKEIKNIVDKINKMETKDIEYIKKNGCIKLNSEFTLNIDECIIENIPKENICVDKFENITIALDNNITDELKQECIARDFVNIIQNYRKTHSFNISDHMKIKFYSSNQNIINSITKHMDYINKTLLCKNLEICNNNTDLEKITFEEEDIFIKTEIVN